MHFCIRRPQLLRRTDWAPLRSFFLLTLVLATTLAPSAAAQGIPFVDETIYIAPDVPWSIMGSRVDTGDANGDGVLDIFIGDGGANQAGQAFVLLGPSFAQRIDVTAPPLTQLSGFGLYVAFDVADVNADGFDDVLIGAGGATINGVANVGRAFISYGPTFTSTRELQLPFPPPQNGTGFGTSGVLCDATGDGIVDAIIGTPAFHGATANVIGRIDIYSGASGFVGPPVTTLSPPNPTVGLKWGQGLLAADRNDDGVLDLLSSHTPNAAAGFVWLDGFVPTAQTLISPAFISVAQPYRILRFADVSGDGVRDLLATDPQKAGGGQVFIALGPSYSQHLYLTGITTQTGANFGDGFDAGDVDRDGHIDLVVGAPDDKFTGTKHRGSVTVLYGPTFTTKQKVWGEYDWSRFGQGIILHDADVDGFPEIFVGCGEEWGGGSLHRLRYKTLTTDGPNSVSLSAGGSVKFVLHRGKLAANKPYMLLMSATGSSPGLSIPYAGGALHLPLNFDAATQVGLAFANSAVFQNFTGTLSTNGAATPRFNVPAGSNDPLLVGLELTFAAVIAESGTYIDSTSHAQNVTLGP